MGAEWTARGALALTMSGKAARGGAKARMIASRLLFPSTNTFNRFPTVWVSRPDCEGNA